MFQRIRTTVMLDGTTTRTVMNDAVEDREHDMYIERERLSRIAQATNNIQSLEECTDALVMIYRHGTVKVYNWVAVPEKL